MNEAFAVKMALLVPLGFLYLVIDLLLRVPPGWKVKTAFFLAVVALLQWR